MNLFAIIFRRTVALNNQWTHDFRSMDYPVGLMIFEAWITQWEDHQGHRFPSKICMIDLISFPLDQDAHRLYPLTVMTSWNSF